MNAALAAVLAAVTFVTPQEGSQTVGVQALDVQTTSQAVNRVDFYVDGSLVGVARTAPYRILHDFGTSLAAHTIAAKVYSNAYRTIESAEILTSALTAGETLNVDLVEVPARVRSSRPLQASDITLKENGIEQTIRDVRSDRGPARFVFIVDRSLSMEGGKLEATLRAIDEESKLLRAEDRVEVVLFNHNVMPARTLARGERAERVFGQIPPSGGTSLRDAVSSVQSHERTYAIVITDGGDRNSITSEDTAVRKVSGTKLILDALILGNSSRFLERAAKNTGGTIANATASTVQRELHRMILDINSRYTIIYQSHGNRSGWRAISITPRRRGIEIANARKGYYAQ